MDSPLNQIERYTAFCKKIIEYICESEIAKDGGAQ